MASPLTPEQLITLASSTMSKRVVSRDATGITISHYKLPQQKSLDQKITPADWDHRIIRAASIMLAESGGIPDKVHVNTGPPSPGSRDRGLWQWNDVAWPAITDAMAFDPDQSTEIAYQESHAFTSWGPWHGSHGLDVTSVPSTTIAAAYKNMLGVVYDDTPILSQIDPKAQGPVAVVKNALGGLLGWADALGRILSHLLDPAFWKRVGLGVAGVALLLFAFKDMLTGGVAAAVGLAK